MSDLNMASTPRKLSIKLFHGTDFKAANQIIVSAFKVKDNRKHWLGHGIYFFVDQSLAQWWTTRPSEAFGCKITVPAIIECTFDYDDDRVLDLRNFKDYTQCIELFEYFCNKLYRPYVRIQEIELTKLRCTFFDWLFDVKKYDAIVGTFDSSKQPYLTPKFPINSDFKHLNLTYTEVQVCVPEKKQSLLKNKYCFCIDAEVSPVNKEG